MSVIHPNIFLSELRALPKGQRHLVAIAGPPGAGKSTLVEGLRDAMNDLHPGRAAVLAMDGYHYDDQLLSDRGLLKRKGSPATFDVGGLRVMLERLHRNQEPEIAVPVFDREIEISRAGAAMIAGDVDVILVEGNYLLLDQDPWTCLEPMFDKTALIRVSEDVLRSRLAQRWQKLGYDADKAQAKIEENDLPNALTVLRQSRCANVELDGTQRLSFN